MLGIDDHDIMANTPSGAAIKQVTSGASTPRATTRKSVRRSLFVRPAAATSTEQEVMAPAPSEFVWIEECHSSSNGSLETVKVYQSPFIKPAASTSTKQEDLVHSSSSKSHLVPAARPRESLRKCESANLLHYGSEESESEEEEDIETPVLLRRTVRVLWETPQDQDEAPCADITDPPLIVVPFIPDVTSPVVTTTAASRDVAAAWDLLTATVSSDAIPKTEACITGVIPATTASYEPVDFLDFKWKAFPDPPVPPEERRERFSVTRCGPTVKLSHPYKIFTAIWNLEFMQCIVTETNRYAQQLAADKMDKGLLSPSSRIADWKDTSVDELYTYFAIVLSMGVVTKSRIEEYWSTEADILRTPGFREHMSLSRFQLLGKCLHFNNSESIGRNLSPSEAKLFKIQPVIDHLNEKFSSMYVLQQDIALDESLMMWKGLLDINQFIPNKAAKVGIKSYEICESQTGYLWRFQIHAHKAVPAQLSKMDPFAASTPAIVLNLIKGLEYCGYTLWMDNYYNSPALARKLKSLGFDCAGTLRTNRKLVPRQMTETTKNDMRPGEIVGFTSGDVDVMIWRDENRVATISTYHGNTVSTVNDVVKPVLIRDYNICMGGVDKKDQMLAHYPIERKRTRIWYKKLFRRLLNISVLNSYLIHKKTAKVKLSHRAFRKELISSLLDHSKKNTLRLRPPIPTDMGSIYEAKHHYPANYPCSDNGNRQRQRCKVCGKRSGAYCAGCNKSVCAFTCFSALHS